MADIGAIIQLFDGYRVFYGQQSDLAAAKSFLTARLEQEESVIFLARSNGNPAAFTQLYPVFSSVSMQRLWLLNDLYTDPEHRKKGAAAALLQAAMDFAKEGGAKGLFLETAVDNLLAQKLYEKLGWKRNDGFFTYYYP